MSNDKSVKARGGRATAANKPVVLITGASSGIGEGLAIEFASRGADLILAARRTERLKALSEKIARDGQRVLFFPCDVTKDDDLNQLVKEARSAFGNIDIVIANAGFGVKGALESITLSDYRRQFETNVFGVLRTLYATLDDLKKSRGRFVVIGSVLGHIALPEMSAYVMSKFALRGLCASIRPELSPHGISVTLISPGLVASEFRKVDNQGVFKETRHETVPTLLVMPVEQAARKIARAIMDKRREAIITTHGKVAVFCKRHFPWLVSVLLERLHVYIALHK